MKKKEIKLNHFNIYAVIAIIVLMYFSIKCIQFYFELEMPKGILETIIEIKNIFILNEKFELDKLLENLLFLLLVFIPPLLEYLFVKKIYKICNYFLSEEKIIISDEHFYYTRKLAIINFEKFEINLNEIKRITKIPMKIPNRFSTNIPALATLWYFKEQKRILIKDKNGKEYKIWNIPVRKFSPSTYYGTPKDNADLYIKELREHLKLEEENIEDSQKTESLNVEMKKLIYSHPDLSEKKESFFILFFFQIFLIFIFLVVFSEGITVFYEGGIEILFFIVMGIACILITYFIIKAMKNAIIYFFPYEEYEIIEDRLYYKKKLKLFSKSFIMEKFDVSLKDIESISSLAPKISYMGLKSLDDFKPCKRIHIRLKNGKGYEVCNFSKNPYNYDFFRNTNKVLEMEFKEIFNNIKSFIENGEIKYNFEKQLEEIKSNYNLEKSERYNFILNKIIEKEKLYLYKNEEKFIVNAEEIAIKNLEIFKTMNFEEMDFYEFYVDYLSKKENQDKKVLVGFNGADGKEVTMSKLKDDINKIRDSKSTFI
ncbi:hypothetical protein LDK18_00865 [Fusobacterium nucleatum subsp. nucleatum ATCC 23726]|uniref:Uncharacterized protein n=1 Tax=Fusobacterium nucleatum subsp. nucleatum (strain ATCC 23726 / VPI 4351) TaxID=525283 RepID=D5RC58_FUSN2|nr:hypothetical protein [Fusobacterium nucleatum]EFG95625.1 hypothetical protein HMPREF0397_0793 [Fusobacterium nucleatum subsp. nucleatum ATCC 23726]